MCVKGGGGGWLTIVMPASARAHVLKLVQWYNICTGGQAEAKGTKAADVLIVTS